MSSFREEPSLSGADLRAFVNTTLQENLFKSFSDDFKKDLMLVTSRMVLIFAKYKLLSEWFNYM